MGHTEQVRAPKTHRNMCNGSKINKCVKPRKKVNKKVNDKVLLSNVECINSSPKIGPKKSLPLDTLEQVRTDPKKTLKKRAKAKSITNSFIFKLIAKQSPLENAYRSTYYCCHEVMKDGVSIKTKYCGYRWCIQCMRIKTAKMIERYLPAIEEMQDAQFVTLTVPAIKAQYIKGTIEEMQRSRRRIIENLRRTYGVKPKAVFKTECNYNPKRGTYNPHYHVIVEGKETAELFVSAWLKQFPNAVRQAQDIRPATNGKLKELFKYFSKVVTKGKVHATALDNIFQAIKGKRIYQAYNMPKIENISDDIEELTSEILEEFDGVHHEVFLWNQDLYDWIGKNTGEFLSGHTPSKTFRQYCKDIRDG